MTEEQQVVFSALATGRLPFPFDAERRALLGTNPRTSREAERLAALDAVAVRFKEHDATFRARMLSGDLGGADDAAGAAADLCSDFSEAGEDAAGA